MTFKNKKYIVVKKAISSELANFLFNYFLMKRQVAKTMLDTGYISKYALEWGTWNEKQVRDTYSHYSDIAMETLLLRTQPVLEKKTGLKLIPNYSYARIYKNGDVLERHKDRFSCEISTTINLGGDPWPIYLEPNKNIGIPDNKKITFTSKNKGVKINLAPGDMIIYSGCELEHWREAFKGTDCAQVFLHYNRHTKENKKNMFDTRIHLGLPHYFTKKQFKHQ
tara:strand:+ start:3278 stop:3946 length:669 start_codon:yes stop_codon:yes gene_type:complete